jgi:hypothetical protein
MVADNLSDRRNAGKSGFYPRETMPGTHLLRLTDPQMLADFPNYEGYIWKHMEFKFGINTMHIISTWDQRAHHTEVT